MSKKKNKKNPEWARAKKLCRLSQEEVAMAQRLGFTPRALIGNIPSPTQRWKAPVKEWMRDLYEEKFPGEAKPHQVWGRPQVKDESVPDFPAPEFYPDEYFLGE